MLTFGVRMKKRIIASILVLALVLAVALVAWLYRVAMPLGILMPTKSMQATMQTQGQTIYGTVYRSNHPHLLFVRFANPTSYSWFSIDMKNGFVGLPNGPRRIIGNLYRPMGLGVLLTSQKVDDGWHVFFDGNLAVFSNAVIQCNLGKTRIEQSAGGDRIPQPQP